MRAFEQAEDSPGQMTFEAALDFSWTVVPRLMLAVAAGCTLAAAAALALSSVRSLIEA